MVNTTTLKITGPGGTNITGVDQGGVATFNFGTVNIRSGVTLNASGTRPFKLAALGSLTVAGIINGNGASATDFVAVANAGGPGGGAGGTQNPTAGSGPGGGGAGASTSDGGGGGGFGGSGARGALSGGGPGGAGGAANGNLDVTLQGGSGGAGGSGTGGGGGGGAIALFGKVVTITSTGRVNANGGGGAVGGTGASGGGSGGGIFVRGNVVENRGQLNAKGGDGGAGGGFGDAGGGGGGRIALRFTALRAAGTTTVSGGISGARTTGGCCGHGGLSPDATGATGVTTQTVGTQVINFDDAVAPDPNPAPCSFINTNALTERYASRGVHFAGPAAGSGGAILNQCGSFGVNGHSSPNFLAFNTGVNYSNGKPASGPETITFNKPISTATINTGQGSGGTATLTAFKGTQVVGSAFRTSTATLVAADRQRRAHHEAHAVIHRQRDRVRRPPLEHRAGVGRRVLQHGPQHGAERRGAGRPRQRQRPGRRPADRRAGARARARQRERAAGRRLHLHARERLLGPRLLRLPRQ